MVLWLCTFCSVKISIRIESNIFTKVGYVNVIHLGSNRNAYENFILNGSNRNSQILAIMEM